MGVLKNQFLSLYLNFSQKNNLLRNLKTITLLISFISFSLFINSCESDNKSGVNSQSITLNENVVIILPTSEKKSKIEFENGIHIPSETYVSFITKNNLIKKVNFSSQKPDTLTLKVEKDFLELIYVSDALHQSKYYLNGGDTLILSTDTTSNKSKINALNYDDNYELIKNQKIYDNQITPYFKLRYPLAFMDRSKDLRKEHARIISNAKNKLFRGHNMEKVLLDSMKSNGLISSENFEHRKRNLEFDHLNFLIEFDEIVSLDSIEVVISKSSDDYINYESFRNFLNHYLEFKYSEDIDIIRSNNGSHKNYKQFFDKVIEDSVISDGMKEFVLIGLLEKIIKYNSKNDFDQYALKFQELSKNDSLIQNLNSKYKFQYDPQLLILKNSEREEVTLSQILEKTSSKLYYIDFWASWCKPCIEEMPYSKKLQKKYNQDEITFVYLSIDESEKKWQKSNLKYDLGPNSYIIHNRYNSTFLEELQLNEIPRYVLIDSNGDILNTNAPSPSSNELDTLFKQYLN